MLVGRLVASIEAHAEEITTDRSDSCPVEWPAGRQRGRLQSVHAAERSTQRQRRRGAGTSQTGPPPPARLSRAAVWMVGPGSAARRGRSGGWALFQLSLRGKGMLAVAALPAIARFREFTLPEGTEMVMPGDNTEMTVALIQPIAMEEGLGFAIREGGRTVGSGRVTKILK